MDIVGSIMGICALYSSECTQKKEKVTSDSDYRAIYLSSLRKEKCPTDIIAPHKMKKFALARLCESKWEQGYL